MIILQSFITILFGIIGFYLLCNCLYLLFFAFAGLADAKKTDTNVRKYRKQCILIPAYKEDMVIIETTRNAVNHLYAGSSDVFVIADGLKEKTLQTLKSLGAGIIEVKFEKSTKGKALQYALSALSGDNYEVAVVLDADNIMGKDFLTRINEAFDEGYQVVQGHRTAKNMDTPFALLDACNEEINNQLFRKGHQAAGLAPNLIGSGMAFDFMYFKKLLTDIGEVAGEDKEIDFRIARDKVKVKYLHHALVYDEKVANAKVFTGQRSRWISAQITCLRKYFVEGFVQLFKYRNVDFFEKAIQTLLMPRVLLLGTLGIMFLQSLVNPYGLPTVYWTVLILTAAAALLIALPKKFYTPNLWSAVAHLPLAFFAMCKALIRSRKTGQSFVHTPHTHNASGVIN